MKRICIICSSKLPQPPTLGGAVPTLIQEWVDVNEEIGNFSFTCVSVENLRALNESKKYKKTNFIYIKNSKVSFLLDKIISRFLILIKKTNKIYSWGFLFRTLCFKRGVTRVLKKGDFDIVLFENSIPVALCMKKKSLAKKYKGKYFYHTHCIPRNAFGSGKVLKNANAVICVSDYIKRETERRFSKYDLKCTVLYNCIDVKIFNKVNNEVCLNWRKQVGLQPSDFAVGFIGRLSKDKGILELIDAFKLINDSTIRLLIAGSTFYNSDTKDKFILKLQEESKSIKDRIIFTGYIENYKTPIFYNSCNVICLPPVWEEPGSITNIEASSCGCAIISTFSGGNEEYIGNHSILLKKENRQELVKEIAETIIKLKSNKDQIDFLKEKAYEWGQKQNSSEFFSRFIYSLNLEEQE